MRAWRGHTLYFCAMGTLSAVCFSVGGQLASTLATVASQSEETKQRPLSRVEKYLAIKAIERNRIRLVKKNIVTAMTAPELPPAVLAAALDRTETASIAEFPVEHAAFKIAQDKTEKPAGAHTVGVIMETPSAVQRSTAMTFTVLAYSAPVTAPLVAGIACSASGCTETVANTVTVAMASPLPDNWPKPSRLGQNKQASSSATRAATTTDRPKPARKLAATSTPPMTSSLQSTPASPSKPVRIADTPGDIIRQSLRGTI